MNRTVTSIRQVRALRRSVLLGLLFCLLLLSGKSWATRLGYTPKLGAEKSRDILPTTKPHVVPGLWQTHSMGKRPKASREATSTPPQQKEGGGRQALALAGVDSDGDGVTDDLDLDDDNDGILDSDECSNLVNGSFLTGNDANWFGDWNISNVAYSNSYNVAVSNKKLIQVISGLNNSSNQVTLVFDVTTDDPFGNVDRTGELDINLGGVTYATITNSSVNVPASITVLNGASTPNNSTMAVGNATSITLTIPWSGKPDNAALEFNFNSLGSNRTASFTIDNVSVPSAVECDTDGDGIPNRLDLDSDGDGCADAAEGGTGFAVSSLSNSTMAGGSTNVTKNLGTTVGNTATTKGVPTVASTGQTKGYSQDNTVNGCTDSDGDGVTDVKDLDDDNDGILDSDECGNLVNGDFATANSTSWFGDLGIPWSVDGVALASAGASSTYSNKKLIQVISGLNNSSNQVKIRLDVNPQDPFSDPKFEGKLDIILGGVIYATLSNASTQTAVTVTTSNGATTPTTALNLGSWTTMNLTIPWSGKPDNAALEFSYSSLGSTNNANFSIDNVSVPSAVECDTDGDGIPNRLDLDSDGDGCADAAEGGTGFAVSSLSNSTMAGGSTNVTKNLGTTVGNTATTKGVPTVASTGQTKGYSQDNTVNGCTDSDGDGVTDVKDLDDDNDGIMDIAECKNWVNGDFNLGAGTGMGWFGYFGGFDGWSVTSGANGLGEFVGNGGFFSNRKLTQVATGLNNGSNVVKVKFDIRTDELATAPQLAGRIDVMLGEEIYASITNPTITSAATFTVLNGASSPQGPQFPMDNWKTIELTIPWVGQPDAAALSFAYTSLGASSNANVNFKIENVSVSVKACDTDGDGIIDQLDLDSDGDGCPDAIEGGAQLATSKLVGSTMPGGSTNVTKNLGNTVGNTDTTIGIPTVAGTGQATGYSQNSAVAACTTLAGGVGDADGDGIPDIYDLDDDNDGILDTAECGVLSNGNFSQGATGWSGGWGIDTDGTAIFPGQSGSYANVELKQVTSGLTNSSGKVTVTFDVLPVDGVGAVQLSGEMQVRLGGVTYATLTNYNDTGGAAKLAVINGATTPNGPEIAMNNWTTISITIPWVGKPDATTLSFAYYSTGGTNANGDFRLDNISITATECDLDGDGLANRVDLDTDADGCPDAIEGGGTFKVANLVSSTMAGGSTSVTKNLGNNVSQATSTYGVPVTATSGQTVGTSENATVQDPDCPVLPTIAITSPVNVTTSSTNPPISGTATPLASVTVNGPNGQSCVTTASAAGSWTCTSLTFTVGSQTVTAVASTTAATSIPANSNFTVVSNCPNPTVGGAASFLGGALCSISNAGSLTLTGQTGTVVKWQTSTDGGTTWTDISGTFGKNYYDFVNAANGQQYRALLNNGGSCSDAFSTPVTIATSSTACSSASCDKSSGTVSFNVTPASTGSQYSHVVIMTDANGTIKYASASGSNSIPGVATGDYLVYLVSYDNTQTPLPTLTMGTSLSAIGGACVVYSAQLPIKVCPSNTFDCANISVAGTFVVGTPSSGTLNVPITGVQAGSVTLTVSGTGFSTTPSPFVTTLTASQTAIAIPIQYDGSGTSGTRSLSISSAQFNNSCTPTVTVSPVIPCTPLTPGQVVPATNSVLVGGSTSFSYVGASAGSTVHWYVAPSSTASPNSGTGTTTSAITFQNAGFYQIVFEETNSGLPAGCNVPSTTQSTIDYLVKAQTPICAYPGSSTVTVTPSIAAVKVGQTGSFSLVGGQPYNNVQWQIIPSAGSSPNTGTGATASNITFSQEGLYRIVFTMTNAGDLSCTPVQKVSSGLISVGLDPCAAPSPVSVIEASGKDSTLVGTSATFNAIGGVPNQGMTWKIFPLTGVSSVSGTGSTASLTFTQPGNYVVTFIASNGSLPLNCTKIIATAGSATIKVYAGNPPIIVPVPVDVDPGKSTTVCMPITDADAVDSFTATICSQPGVGTAIVSVNNTTRTACLVYTAPASGPASTSVCVKVCDSQGNCTQNIIPVIVNPGSNTAVTPLPPVVVVVPVLTPKDTPVQVCMPIKDPNTNDTHTVSVCGNPTNGTATASVNNTTHELCISYTPTPGSVGQDAMCVIVCDPSGQCTTVTVPITVVDPTPPGVTPVAPKVTPVPVVTTPDTPVVVCTPIVDNAGDTHTASLCSQPSSGTASVAVDNTTNTLCITYTPGSQPTSTSLCIQVCDQGGLCTTVVAPVTVLPKNQAPLVNPDVNTFVPGIPTAGNVLTNDKDPEGTPLTASVAGTPPAGFTLNPDGSYTYTSPASQTAPVSVTVNVCDSGTPPACATSVLTMTPVTPPSPVTNDAPVALNDATRTTAGTSTTVNVLANDKDPEGQPLSNPTIVGQPTNGTAGVNPDGTIRYTPNAGFVGTDRLTYQVCDTGSPVMCATAVVTFTVDPAKPAGVTNTAPVAIDDQLLTTKNVSATGTVAANDSDPEGQPLVFSKLTGPTHGTVVFSASGTYTYTPAAGFVGSDNFTYQVCDNATPALCATATAYVTVSDPCGVTIAAPLITPTSVTVCNTGSLILTAIGESNATFTWTGSSLTAAVTGQTLAIASLPSGVYQFSVIQEISGCTSKVASTSVLSTSVVCLFKTPVAIADLANTNINTPVSGNVLTNDSDPQGLPLIASLLAQPVNGTVTLSPNGSYTYTPPVGFTGNTTFCYIAQNTAGKSGTACVSVNVNPSPGPYNDRPVANNDNTQTQQGIPVTIAVLANDTDPDAAATPEGQLANPTLLGQPATGTVVANANGTFTYTPPAGFTGTVSFPYQVCDKATTPLCATALVSILVQPTSPVPVTLAPVAVDDALLVQVNMPKTGTVADNDSDPQGLPLVYITGQPQNGTVIMSSNGSYTYTPAPGYSGPDNFTYLVCNTAAKCDVATVSVTVQRPATTPPVVIGIPVVTLQGSPVTVCMNIIDSDQPDSHTAIICGQPAGGSAQVVVNNTTHQACVTYTPITSFTGATTICVQVCDTYGNCTQTIIPVSVIPFSTTTTSPQAPVVVVVPVVTAKDLTTQVCMPIIDPNVTDTHSVSLCSSPAKGSVTAVVNNTTHEVCITYKPNAGITGQDAICIVVCDKTGLCTQVSIPVTIVDPVPPGPAIKPPVVVPPVIITHPGEPIVVCTGINDTVTDTHTATICGQPVSGNAIASVNNTSHVLCITYTPGSTPVSTTMCVQVCDQTGQCTNVIIPVTVISDKQPCLPVNLAGVSVDISNGGAITAGQSASFTLNGANPAYKVDWFLTPSTGVTPASNGTGLSTGSLTFAQPGDYMVWYKLTNSAAGCTTPTEALVKGQLIVYPSGPNPCPAPASISIGVAPTASPSVGQTATFTMLGGTPNTAVTWSVYPAVGVSPTSGTGTTANVQFGQSGNYIITFVATNSQPGCSANSRSASTSVYVRSGGNECITPTPVVITPLSVTANTGTSVTFVASGGVPGVITWSILPGNSVTPFSGTGTVATPVFTVPGTYIITFTSTNDGSSSGCTLLASTATSLAYQVLNGGNTVSLKLKVLLQGALLNATDGFMRDDLRAGNYLPLKEPYSAIGSPRFVHTGGGGGETMPASVTALNVGTGNAIVDWVFVELRNPANMSVVVATRSALVQRDGDVVLASDGTSPLTFTGLSGSSYFVSVKHRNHLGVMTATAIPLSTTGTVVDFTDMTDAEVWNMSGPLTFDGAERVTMAEAGGKKALWAGNAYNDAKEHAGLSPDRVKYQGPDNDLLKIFSEMLNYTGNTSQTYNYDFGFGYWFGDVNMDGKVKYQGPSNDSNIIFLNVIDTYPLNTNKLYNFDLFYEQLP